MMNQALDPAMDGIARVTASQPVSDVYFFFFFFFITKNCPFKTFTRLFFFSTNINPVLEKCRPTLSVRVYFHLYLWYTKLHLGRQ